MINDDPIAGVRETEAQRDALIELFNARDERALELLNRRWGAFIYKTAFNVLQSREDAQEIANDTLAEVWNSIPPDRPESFAGYLSAICRSNAIDRIRGDRAKKRFAPRREALNELDGLFTESFESALVDSMEIKRILNGFVRALDPLNRYVFLRRYFDAEKPSRIAAETGLSVNSVNTRLFRMREKLRAELERSMK